MPPSTDTIREGIDATWLEELERNDPVTHAYALWDLKFAPERVRFVTLLRDGTPVAYLLIWYGVPHVPVAQWIGLRTPHPLLLKALPDRPLIAVVPEEVAEAVRIARAPIRSYPVEVMVLGRAPRALPASPPARRLTPADTPAVRRLAE
ncbi:MAG: hypothetical protein ACHQ2Y_10585, partial [Candidatus Lutacidiplasmatales archaeon]